MFKITGQLILVGLCLSSSAVAQVMPWKMSTNQVSYQINSSMPYAGDAPTIRAAATWTNAGSRLQFSNGGLTSTGDVAQTSATDVPGTQIQSRPASFYTAVPNWGGLTFRTRANGTSTTITSDADIVINADKIAAGHFYYGTGTPPSNQADYESVLLHELGHVAGFDEDVNSSAYCAMKPTIMPGQVWRTPCPAEVTALKNKYGTP